MYSGSIIFFWEINITVKTKYTMIIVFRSTCLSAGNRGKYISHLNGVSKKFIGKLFGNGGLTDVIRVFVHTPQSWYIALMCCVDFLLKELQEERISYF